MPHRWPLRAAVLSALAVCAAGCASTPGASTTSAVKKAGAAAKPLGTGPGQVSTISPPGTSVEAQLQSAHMLRAQGKLPEATRALAQLVLVSPDDSRVIGEYGKALV